MTLIRFIPVPFMIATFCLGMYKMMYDNYITGMYSYLIFIACLSILIIVNVRHYERQTDSWKNTFHYGPRTSQRRGVKGH